MSNLYNTLVAITEKPVGDIMRKQRSIYRLWPQFDDRVDKVASKGGIRLVGEGKDTWNFTIASGTVDGKKYHATLNFADLDAQIKDKARNKGLWNREGTKVDYNKLAAAIIDDVDVRIDHPDCPAFLYWGQKYITTQRQTAYTDKEDRRPRIRNPKEYGHLCKHLQLLFEQLPFYTSTLAKMLKRYHSDMVTDVEGGAKTTQAGFSKAADFLGARQGGSNGPSTGPSPAKLPKTPSPDSGADKLQPDKKSEPSANNDVKTGAKDNTETPTDVKKGVKSATGDIDVLSKEEREERDRMSGEGGIGESKNSNNPKMFKGSFMSNSSIDSGYLYHTSRADNFQSIQTSGLIKAKGTATSGTVYLDKNPNNWVAGYSDLPVEAKHVYRVSIKNLESLGIKINKGTDYWGGDNPSEMFVRKNIPVDAIEVYTHGGWKKLSSVAEGINIRENAEITPEMIKHFEERTRHHIDLVRKSIDKIVKKFPEFSELKSRGLVHDDSKFLDPERIPYILLTWQNKTSRGGAPTERPSMIDKGAMRDATMHHITTNSHHPEFHNKTDANVNIEDRNKSDIMINATAMPPLDVAEMVADWNAMSEELKTNTARQWFEKQRNVRWHFTPEQEVLINKLLTTFE